MAKDIEIGDRIRDKITSFEGIATGLAEYLNGCRQFLITPEKTDKEGKKIDGLWIDEQTLEVVKKSVFANPFPRDSFGESAKRATAGGPSSPQRRT